MDKEIQSKPDIWQGDLLGRKQDAAFLIDFLMHRIEERALAGRTRSYVLNLNAQWGQGKTFFLTRLKQQLNDQDHLVAYVNAWADDHADDPMIAVMSAIDETINPLLKEKPRLKKIWLETKKSGLNIVAATAKSSAIHLTKKFVGDVFEAASEAIDNDTSDLEAVASKATTAEVEALFSRQGSELLDKFNRGKAAIKSFRDNLRDVLPQIESEKSCQKLPLFVLVDELDRCRPTYAIALLERVKHLFEVDNVVFIIATDSDQLKHSINAVYGMGFDSSGYLLRFFDRTYVFEEPKLEDFVANLFQLHEINEEILSSPPNISHQDFFVKIVQAFNLRLRDVEQCFDMLRSIATVWSPKVPIELIYMLPLIVAFLKSDDPLMETLINGSGDIQAHINNKIMVSFNENTRGSYARSKKEYSFQNMIQILFTQLNRSLPELIVIDHMNENGCVQWLYYIFSQEFSRLHSNSHNTDNPPYSIMQKYPEYVRSAGRLLIVGNRDENEN